MDDSVVNGLIGNDNNNTDVYVIWNTNAVYNEGFD